MSIIHESKFMTYPNVPETKKRPKKLSHLPTSSKIFSVSEKRNKRPLDRHAMAPKSNVPPVRGLRPMKYVEAVMHMYAKPSRMALRKLFKYKVPGKAATLYANP